MQLFAGMDKPNFKSDLELELLSFNFFLIAGDGAIILQFVFKSLASSFQFQFFSKARSRAKDFQLQILEQEAQVS